jgi:hypothetical protein
MRRDLDVGRLAHATQPRIVCPASTDSRALVLCELFVDASRNVSETDNWNGLRPVTYQFRQEIAGSSRHARKELGMKRLTVTLLAALALGLPSSAAAMFVDDGGGGGTRCV